MKNQTSREIWFTTQWSVVYNMNSGEILIAMGRKYDSRYQFKLDLKKL